MTRYEDLVVVLLEPSDKAEDVPYEEMFQASTALKHLDDALFLAFNGRRRVENTIVLDIEEHIKDDAHAYTAFEEVSALLYAKILLLCLCQTSEKDLPAEFSSSVKESQDRYK